MYITIVLNTIYGFQISPNENETMEMEEDHELQRYMRVSYIHVFLE